jgi:hypothetical protein
MPDTIRQKLVPGRRGIELGVRLFRLLVTLANQGHSVGISYGGFIARLHGVSDFPEVAGRRYAPVDNQIVIEVAYMVTEAAGGRQRVSRSHCSIDAGMDTFIWRKDAPHDRSLKAWSNPSYSLPYTHEEWISVFPEAERRLIAESELSGIS